MKDTGKQYRFMHKCNSPRNTVSSIANQTASLPLAMRFYVISIFTYEFTSFMRWTTWKMWSVLQICEPWKEGRVARESSKRKFRLKEARKSQKSITHSCKILRKVWSFKLNTHSKYDCISCIWIFASFWWKVWRKVTCLVRSIII